MVKNSIKHILGLSVALTTLVLSGCKDDTILPGADNELPGIETPSGDEMYMAIRIYNAGSVETGSRSGMDPNFDSNGKDYDGSAGGKFNTGLASENAIYPSGTKTDCPNYLLIFGKSDTDLEDQLECLLPLFDWDYAENGKPKSENDNEKFPNNTGYTDYNTFYTSANKYELPESFDNRKVLVVLNASALLQTKLKAALKDNEPYESIMKWKIGDPSIIDDDFLYYISPDNTKYFTMSSSIVIPMKDLDKALTQSGYKGPSVVKWNYAWCKDRTSAAQKPVFSFFIERLQSKFTLTIKVPKEDKYCYFTTNPDAVEKGQYIPLINSPMVISSTDMEEAQTIQYIKTYKRRRNGNPEDKDYVKQFIETAGEWKINLMGWNVNGVHRQEYLFKQIDKDKGYYDGWNVENYSPYRNFWAESPLYDEQRTIPDQYRRAKVLKYGYKEVEGVSTPSKSLTYASLEYDDNVKAWDNVKDRQDIMTYFTFNGLNEFSPHQYSAENTYDPVKQWPNKDKWGEIWKGRAYMRAGNHIILTAQLLIEGLDPEDVFSANKFNPSSHLVVGNTTGGTTRQAESKYYMNDIYWSAEAYREYVGEYIGYWMQEDEETFGHNDGVFYVPNFDNNTHEPIFPSDLSNLVPAESQDFFIEPLGVEGGDGWAHVIPNIASIRNDLDVQNMTDSEKEKTVVFYAYDPDNVNEEDGSPIFTPITMKTFELLAHAHPEYYARHFNAGRMYYSIPVTHYDPEKAYMSFSPGRYGAVRNHWYNYTVTSIKNIGTSVSDPSADLIIPNTDHSYDALGLTLSVLPWHWVEEDVDITSQRKPANPDEIDLDLYIKAEDWNYEGSDYKDGF